MQNTTPVTPTTLRTTRMSFAVILGMLVVAASMKLGTPLLMILFSYFALQLFNFKNRKLLALLLFATSVLAIFYAFGYFIRQALIALPEAANEAIPKILDYAQSKGVQLPFHDMEGLKHMIKEEVGELLGYLANFAKIATKEFILAVIGVVVAAGMFLYPALDLDKGSHVVPNNLYELTCEQILKRFRNFYHSFVTVMGAQLIISAINTVLTAIFIFSVHLKYSIVLVGVTFLCGLFPIIGNLTSNCVIVGVAFTISPNLAIASLAFLVFIQKLEYFLNSKIIGDRIRTPVWMTLIGLLIGEKLMGIPGMILAPVLLHYIKTEASAIQEIALPPIPEKDQASPPQAG